MPIRPLSLLLLAASLTSLGCHAQVPDPSKQLSPAVAHRLEVLLRQKAQLPPASAINIGPRQPSDLPGYDKVAVTFTSLEGSSSHPIEFLVSADGKTVAQFNKYDISADPKTLVSAEGRPSRGGPANAPVLIVGFDDLECPYCARIHESLFPAITQRYGDTVRFVYKDFPLPPKMHPWAMRASVDVNCMASQSPAGYWNLVDYIHAHYGDIGVPSGDGPKDRTIPLANDQLDKLTLDQGKFQKVDMEKLTACVRKQDESSIAASQKIGEALSIDATPALFINGDKIDGAVPIEFIFHVIDDALRAENITPPPPYVAPAPPTPSVTPAATPAAKSPTGK